MVDQLIGCRYVVGFGNRYAGDVRAHRQAHLSRHENQNVGHENQYAKEEIQTMSLKHAALRYTPRILKKRNDNMFWGTLSAENIQIRGRMHNCADTKRTCLRIIFHS